MVTLTDGRFIIIVRGSSVKIQEVWGILSALAAREHITAKESDATRSGESGGDIRVEWEFSGPVVPLCRFADRLCHRIEQNGSFEERRSP